MKNTMVDSERNNSFHNLWEEQMATRQKLMRQFGGNFALYVATVPKLYRAFYRDENGELNLKDRQVVCIDEGTTGGVCLAGAGILEGVDRTVEMLECLEVETIHSHGGCGAVAKYATDNSIETPDPDLVGQEFAAKVARILGIHHHHIRKEQLRRPPSVHTATVVYYSGVKAFDPAQLPGQLPAGFVITRALRRSAQPAKEEVAIACQIAFGAHGFGDKFTPTNPLLIVPVGNPHRDQLSLEELTKELQPVVEEFKDRVMISGFTSPF